MKCPFCGNIEDRVIDSRMIRDGMAIRRRRECLGCKKRFTSYETIEEIQFKVTKKDGRREDFDRNKIRIGIEKSCEKRPVSIEVVEELVDKIETELLYLGQKEIPSREIGEVVIRELYHLDEVAYVRFASVYRAFKGIDEFDKFLEELKSMIDRESLSRTREFKFDLPDETPGAEETPGESQKKKKRGRKSRARDQDTPQ